MATKKKISEQVQRIYSRYVDRENIEPTVYNKEVQLLIEQSLNEILELKSAPSRLGRVNIPQASIAKYTVAVSSSQSTLPAFPINLERDMGIYDIVDPASPLVQFIPLSQQKAKIFQGTISSNLENQIGYYRYGDTIHFLTDPDTDSGNVDLYLIVSDLSQLGDNDPLPISSDQEAMVIRRTLELLGIGAFSRNEMGSRNNREDLIKEAKDAN